MVNKLNDVTLDIQQIVELNEVVADDATGSSAVFDLKQVDPCRFNVRINWYWPTPALSIMQTVTVVGGLEPNFASGYFLLAQQMMGAADSIAALSGPTIVSYRGTGPYVIPCSNVSNYTTLATGLPTQAICRYIQVWVQTTGVGSSIAFSANVETQ